MTEREIHFAIATRLSGCVRDTETNVVHDIAVGFIDEDGCSYIALDNGQRFKVEIREIK